MNPYVGAFANVPVIRTFISILEASPSTDVINKDGTEFSEPAFDITQEFTQTFSAYQTEAALTASE